MIHSIFIIHETLGCLIDVHCEPKLTEDPQLIGGYLVAFVQLAREWLKDTIDEIQLQNSKLVFRQGEKTHLVALVSRDQALTPGILECVNTILDRFVEQFPWVESNQPRHFESFAQWIAQQLHQLKGPQDGDLICPITIS
ncbi:MAG: hypothetical protein ACFFFG_11870 [Candidatus Thorarchaeota archaeon]